MAVPCRTTPALDDAYKGLTAQSQMIKDVSASVRARSLTGNCTASELLVYRENLIRAKAQMQAIIAAYGQSDLATYIQSQASQPTFDPVAEYTAHFNAIDATIKWIGNNAPKDGSGNLLVQHLPLDSLAVRVEVTFTSVQLTGLRTAIDALTATIQ